MKDFYVPFQNMFSDKSLVTLVTSYFNFIMNTINMSFEIRRLTIHFITLIALSKFLVTMITWELFAFVYFLFVGFHLSREWEIFLTFVTLKFSDSLVGEIDVIPQCLIMSKMFITLLAFVNVNPSSNISVDFSGTSIMSDWHMVMVNVTTRLTN